MTAYRKKNHVLLCLALLFPCTFAMAGDMESMIVTGMAGKKASDTSMTTITLSRQQIDTLNKENLTDILRTIPGMLVNAQGGPGGNTDVSIRGAEPNFIAVYIDGVLVNDPINARGVAFNFNSININTIDHIEVIKGPASVLYGSNAIAGVIRIFTAPAKAANHHTLAVETDHHANTQYAYRLSDTAGNTDYSLGVARNDFQSDESKNLYQSDELNARVAVNTSDSNQLLLQLRYMRDESEGYPEQSGGPEFAASNSLDEMDSNELTGAVGITHALTKKWDTELQASYFHREGSMISPGIVPYTQVPPNREDSEYTNTSLQWKNRLVPAASLRVNAGIDARLEEGKSDGLINFGFPLPVRYAMERDTIGTYLHLDWEAVANGLVQASIRNDNPDNYSSQTTRQLGFISPRLANLLTISATWGEGFKLPGFSALSHPLTGNAFLKPETSSSSELGFEFRLDNAATLVLTGFHNEYRNLIDFDPLLFKMVNRSRVRTSGAEVSLSLLPTDTVTVDLDATYTDFDVIDGDEQFTGRPRLVAGFLSSWQPADNWIASADYRWSDSRRAGTLHTGSAQLVELDAYHTLDVRLAWTPAGSFSITLAVDNILDEQYEEAFGVPSPGRTFRLGGEFRL